MKKNLFCPNLSLPENKALIEKLGLFGFYREYVNSNYNISQSVYEDVYDGTLSVEDMLYINKDLFTGAQQDQVVDSILFQVQKIRNTGENNVGVIKNRVLEDFKKTLNFITANNTNDRFDSLISHYNNTIEHYDEFFDRVNKKLASQDITIDSNDVATFNEEESTYDSAENLNEKLNYSDESSFQQSSKDTASANLKIALSLIPKYVYENGQVVLKKDGKPLFYPSILNTPTLESLDSIWNDLLFTLVDIPIGSKLDYLLNSTNPKHRVIGAAIRSNPDVSIRNQFETVFSKQQSKFVTVSYSRPDESGVKSIKVLDTNRMNADNLLVDFWYESFISSPLIKSVEGERAINTELGAQLLDRYNNAVKLIKTDLDAGLADIKSLLSEIGVDISMKALQSEGIWIGKELNTPVSIINNKLKYVFETVAGLRKPDIQAEDLLELNNPYTDENSSLELLAKLENRANPNVFEASFISGDGKAKYSFVNNTYTSHKTRQLKTDLSYLNKLKGTAYASGSYYLNKLISDPSFRDTFELEYVDTLGNDSVNQPNKTFSRMNTKEKELTKVALFQNAGRGTSANASNIGQFVGLVPSDKSTTPLFKTLKVDVRVTPNTNAEGNYGFNAATMEVVMDQFMSEYNRVKQTLLEMNDDSIRKINQYHTGAKMGAKFIIFPTMNTSLIQNGKLLELDDTRMRDIVRPRLQKMLSDLTKDQIAYWKELGIYPNADNYNNFFDKSYMSKVGMTVPSKPLKDKTESKQSYKQRLTLWKDSVNSLLPRYSDAFAANYAVNQFVFMMNQTQLISGDPALHGKSIIRDLDPDTGSAYSKTWVNFYKRMAKDIAPGTDGNFGDNATYNTIFLKDFNYASKHVLNYAEKVSESIGENYKEINPADAQEYTTLDEHLDVMRAYGRLDKAGEEAAERLKQGGTDINDIQLILQPMKPVYVNSQIEGGINTMYYIKSSSFPLIPALTQGLEIDKLRQFMESNNIQRAAYESAAKLGVQGDLSDLSTDGVVWADNLNIEDTTVINLSRGGFRLQQEMPYHGDSATINEGSQGRKLVLNNLKYSDIVNYNGKQYTGSEMKSIFENLHIEKMDRSLNQLTTDLGFDVETGRLTDISKIQDIIREEAESRNYPINDLYSIQLVEENGKNTFKVPLSFTNNATRFESILNSLFTNRVIRNDLPGFMGIQGASSGFQRVATADVVEGSVFESGITWLNPNDTELNYIREDENGNILPADILVPNYLRDSSGNKINVSEYVKEDGTLDTDRIPEDMLTVIGQRIPTQGYNSMMKFKVKGFLPNIVGDLVIVPAEVVIQMGSDFDVDKIFVYNYRHKINKDGSVKKVTTNLPDSATEIDYSNLSSDQIDNLIIQTFEDRLSDKSLMDQILTPNGFGSLPEVSDIVSNLDKTKKGKHSFSTREQNNISEVNSSGKMGTAVFSLFSTFFKSSQDAGLTIRSPFKVKKSNGEVVELDNLSSLDNIEGTRRSDVIMYLQSAAVDNAKEQILGNLNINDHTMGVAGTMAMLGYPEDFIGYFLSQPVLREFSSIVSNANDIVSGELNIEAASQAISDLESNLLSGVSELSLSQVNDTIIGVEDLRSFLEDSTSNELLPLAVLRNFGELLELADTIQTLQSATNVDTKGLGANYGAIQAKLLQLNKVTKGLNNPEYPILGAENLFNDNTVHKANETLIKANQLLGQVYSYNGPSYKNVINEILNEASLAPTEANLRDIYSNIKSFILTNPNLLNLEEINTTRDSLLYGKDNIAQRWLDYSKSPEGKRNPLTKRVTPKFAKTSEDYNGVKAINTPASNNSHDINSSILYFYDMLNSSNTTERQLGEDLVKYHVLSGAQYGPQSIGKYITYDVLEKFDFSKKLRDIDRDLRNSQLLNNFNRQYFQNNPFKATTFDVNQIGGSLAEVIVVNTNNNNLRNRDNNAVAYFSVYDSENRTPVLYERSAITPSSIEYTKIPVLGNKFIKSYDYLNNDGGAITREEVESLPNTSNPITEALKDPVENTAEDLLQNRYGNNNSIREVLDNIKNKSNNPYFIKVASDLLNSNALSDVNLEYSGERLANGWFTGNTVYINPHAINSTKFNLLDKFEEVFLHELLHAGTISAVNNYDNLNDTGKKAVKKINRLFTEYVNSVENQEELSKYVEVNNRRLAGQTISAEERQFLVDNKTNLYHLTSVEEFIAAGLTNPEVTSDLKSKNLWTRLMDLIADILGINTNDLQFLYDNTLDIIDSQTDTDSRVAEDLFESNEEYNRTEFVSQRDEFLRAHKTFIGKRITDNTLQKFKKSQQSKDKYNRLEVDSWNGELRIKRVDPIYEDISEQSESKIETESVKDRTINSYLNRLKDSLTRFNRRKRQLGDDVNPALDSKITNLEKRIKELESERSISNFMTIAENKLTDISNNYSNYADVDSVNDALSYTSALKSINQTIQFTEEFEDWNNRINSISGKAVTLDKRLKQKGAELLSEYLNDNIGINYNISEAINQGIKDISWGEANFLDSSQSSSEHVQSIGYMVDNFQFQANQEHDDFNSEFIPLIQEYKTKYKKDYTQLMQTDSKGNPTGFLLNKYSQEYYDRSKGNFKFYNANTRVELTKEASDRYEADKKQAFENLSTNDFIVWESHNNPNEYIKTWKLGKNPTQAGAKRYLRIVPTDSWIDPNYSKLNSLPENDPARKLYNFIEPILRRNNKRYNQQANYLPELQKTASDHLLEGKSKNAVNKLKENLANSFTEDLVVDQTDIDVLTGEPRLHIPVQMFNNKLDVVNKSLDLGLIAEKVKYQEISLRYKYQAEPILNLYYNILKGSRSNVSDQAPNRVIEHSQFLIQNYLYDRNRSLSETERKYGKVTDKVISYSRIVGMGWNPFSAIGNITQGITSNFTYSSDGRFFTKKEYVKATSTMMHSIAGNTETAKKISNMFTKFDTFVKTNELNFGKSKELATATQSKLKSALEPYNMQQKGEYFVQGQTMVGILLNTKIETPSGEKISVFDGYDSNGVWNPEYGEDPYTDKQKLFRMTMKIRKAIIDVHGNYARPIMAKKDFFARMAMIFRTWLPQAINVRFGAETTDILLGTVTKGRYRTAFGGNFFKDANGKFDFEATSENLKWLIGLSKNNSLSQVDQENMRKNLTELAMILALTIAIAGLKAGLDDLDDDEKQYATYVLNTMSRASGDLTFFLIPSSANAIFQDPIPLMKTIQNTLDVLPAGWNFILGDDEYTTGSRKGKSKLGKEITDLIPLITQIDKNINYSNMVIDNL